MLLPTRPHPGLMARFGISPNTIIAAMRSDVVNQIERTAPDQIEEVIREIVIAAGGRLGEPDRSDWGPFDWSLTLHGITATGDTLAEAVAQWRACVSRCSH
jgi:hypothetical protein